MERYFSKPVEGYHFSSKGIKTIEEKYGAKYIGYFCTKRLDGKSWNEIPADVFYQSNPDTSKGHKHYFGLYIDSATKHVMITDATSAVDQNMLGIVADDGQVVISGYVHDFRRSNDGSVFIDGGRDYTRYGCSVPDRNLDTVHLVQVKVVNDSFVVV